MKNKKIIYLSLIATLISTFTIGIQIDRNQIFAPHFNFGYPTEWLHYFGLGRFGFNLFGLLFNYFFFYFIFFLLIKMLNKILSNRKREKNKEFDEKRF